VICTKKRVKRRTYFYCPECYRQFKDDIKSNIEWIVELRKVARSQEYTDKKFKNNILLLDDDIWIGGKKIKFGQDYVWIGGRKVKVKDLVKKKQQQDYLGDGY